jgi:hypothetical protein
MAGVVTGETISNKVFGLSKKWYLNILEIFLFITLLIVLFNNLYISQLDYFIVFVINFLFGTIAIMITRGILSGAGFFSKKVKKKYELNKEIDEKVIILGLTRNLLRKGLNNDEIKDILENSGLNKGKVRNSVKKIGLEKEEVMGTKRNLVKNS